ncbi:MULTISPECIES: VOC family protein [unclassified Caballeronia]|uniref:4-hydroxyphenylpyruvate dioxygenase family protein n=1 Tax=unclassified Caballeronia TaxID=2646786 RepID=UPI0028541CA8|nr:MULTISPECIES: VOC family protein [unclassified Caballeronia]MDR5775509.1 VOC family protein [Caballeronia sp. LZ002]MDR5801821.1 VOC family protein [Caballeronia sp. LZ001]MDR5850947.1 VOC family protein [Caballeronia sp. LZ003]
MTQPDSTSPARATPDCEVGDNPLGIAGLEFVEFSSPDPQGLAALFERLGFVPVAQHVSKAVKLFRQGSMNFLLNAEPDSFASRFAESHGVGIAAIGIRVVDAALAHERAVEFGAWDFEGEKIGPNELAIPAIQGIGDSHIYFVDHWPGKDSGVSTIYDIDFRPIAGAKAEPGGTGLFEVDHFTQTVGAGRIREWLDFYREVLHFSEIHQVHPDWHVSQDSAVTVSPCGNIRIPVYEEGTYRTDLMQQYLPDHEGEGVQHIALASQDIFASVDALMARGMRFLNPPPRYYDQIDERLPGHGLDIDKLRARGILVDGEILPDGTPQLFLQTFAEREPGDMFFEIVERRGHHGFGEGNLSAIAKARG